MDFHPAANIFPLLEGREFDELVADIEENGLHEPIVVDIKTKTILDGRNRYRACLVAGVEPVYSYWEGDDPVSYVLSLNLHRRHLSESQRGMVADNIARLRKGDNQHAQICAPSQAEAADLLSVSRRTVQHSREVHNHGAPELVSAVERGEVAVSTAATVAALPVEEQVELVARGEKEIIATANRLKAQIKAKRQKERQEEIARVAARLADDPPGVTLICDDFRNVWLPTNKIEEASIDFIITDPPYDKGSVGMFASLSEFAAEVLKPTGSLLCMAGQTYLPGVVENLARYLEYYWTLAYTTPGGQSPQIWPRFVNTFWKPVFWYVPKTAGKQDREWIGDVIKSDANDKRFHKWGQSESGMFALMSKFVKPGQTILDPFCGGGTTAVVAIALGCNFIGIDVDQASIDTTRVRLSEMQNDSL